MECFILKKLLFVCIKNGFQQNTTIPSFISYLKLLLLKIAASKVFYNSNIGDMFVYK